MILISIKLTTFSVPTHTLTPPSNTVNIISICLLVPEIDHADEQT